MPPCRRILLAGCCSALAVAGARAAGDAFNWDAITPSPDLEYHDCYGEFKCARLEVPLDWVNGTESRRAAVAMVKLPAVVPDDDPAFGGSIFTNPGGPSNSGVDFMLLMGRHLRRTVDKPGRRHYEIVSFDPRGVGRTIPRSDCFHGDLLARDAYLLESRGNGSPASGDGAIAYSLAMMDAFGRRCHQAGDAMAFVGTPSVARDMVEMVDRIDELRKREAARRRGQRKSFDDGCGIRPELKKREAMLGDEAGDVPRLQYIGFSYGTVLGNYFASMFPGRVGRLILDGVCDADDYAIGPGWLTNTVDADDIFGRFVQGCVAAGPGACALARDADASAPEIRARINAFLSRLDETPQAILTPSGDAVVITGDDVRAVIGMTLYRPAVLSKRLAVILNNLMSGDMDEVAGMVLDIGLMPSVRDACPLDNITTPPKTRIAEAQHAIVCGDGDDIADKGISWWRKYVGRQVSLSSLLGPTWATIRLPCSGWRIRANWQFKGPFTTPEPDPSLSPGRPAAPILFLSNRLDPVTPLRAARAMAAKHPGAKVVVQEAMGHCAVASAPSRCTRNAVADYLESGTLPSGNSTCEADCGPWDEHCEPIDDDGAEAASAWFNQEAPLRLRSPLGLM